MDEKKIAEILKEAQLIIQEKDDIENLKKVLGKVFTENVDLNKREYNKIKKYISQECDENGKNIKIDSAERRERIKENYYGTCINLLVNTLGAVADILQQQIEQQELLDKIADKLGVNLEKEE